MAGMENDRQAEYVRILQIALEDAWRAAMHLDDPNYFSQKQFLIMELAKAKAYASQLKPGPANDDAAKGKTAPEIGDEMEDGTILAGYYEGKPLYATPRDAPGTYTFNEAAKYAKNLDAHGHHDFHAPSQGELNLLWENRNKGKLKGTFNETGSVSAGWYWSSTPNYYRGNFSGAWTQRFSDGGQSVRMGDSSLRLVR
jgi:Protein of unknown function (DUF1566)